MRHFRILLVIVLIHTICARNTNLWTVDKEPTNSMETEGVVFFHNTPARSNSNSDSGSISSSVPNEKGGNYDSINAFSHVIPDQARVSQAIGLTRAANKLRGIPSSENGKASFASFAPVGDIFVPLSSELFETSANVIATSDSENNLFPTLNFGTSADNSRTPKESIDFSQLGISKDNMADKYSANLNTNANSFPGSGSILEESKTIPSYFATDARKQGSLFDSMSLHPTSLDNSNVVSRDPISLSESITNSMGSSIISSQNTNQFSDNTDFGKTFKAISSFGNIGPGQASEINKTGDDVNRPSQTGQIADTAGSTRKRPMMQVKDNFIDQAKRPVMRVKSAFVDFSGRQNPNMKPIGNFVDTSELEKTTQFISQINGAPSPTRSTITNFSATGQPASKRPVMPNVSATNIPDRVENVVKPPRVSDSSIRTTGWTGNSNPRPVTIATGTVSNVNSNGRDITIEDGTVVNKNSKTGFEQNGDNLKVELLYPPAPFPSGQSDSSQLEKNQVNQFPIRSQNRNMLPTSDSNQRNANLETGIIGIGDSNSIDYDFDGDANGITGGSQGAIDTMGNRVGVSGSSGVFDTDNILNRNSDRFITEPNVQVINPGGRNIGRMQSVNPTRQQNTPSNQPIGVRTNNLFNDQNVFSGDSRRNIPVTNQEDLTVNQRMNVRPIGSVVTDVVSPTSAEDNNYSSSNEGNVLDLQQTSIDRNWARNNVNIQTVNGNNQLLRPNANIDEKIRNVQGEINTNWSNNQGDSDMNSNWQQPNVSIPGLSGQRALTNGQIPAGDVRTSDSGIKGQNLLPQNNQRNVNTLVESGTLQSGGAFPNTFANGQPNSVINNGQGIDGSASVDRNRIDIIQNPLKNFANGQEFPFAQNRQVNNQQSNFQNINQDRNSVVVGGMIGSTQQNPGIQNSVGATFTNGDNFQPNQGGFQTSGNLQQLNTVKSQFPPDQNQANILQNQGVSTQAIENIQQLQGNNQRNQIMNMFSQSQSNQFTGNIPAANEVQGNTVRNGVNVPPQFQDNLPQINTNIQQNTGNISFFDTALEDINNIPALNGNNFGATVDMNSVNSQGSFPQLPGNFQQRLLNPQTAGNSQMFGNQQIARNQQTFGNQQTLGNQQSFGDQQMLGNQPTVGNQQTFGNQQSFGDQQMLGNPQTVGNQQTFGNQQSFGNQQMFGNQQAVGNQQTLGNQRSSGNQQMFGNQQTAENQQTLGDQQSFGNGIQQVNGNPQVTGNQQIFNQLAIRNQGTQGNMQIAGNQQLAGNQQTLANQQMIRNQQTSGIQPMNGVQQTFENQQVFGNQQIPTNVLSSRNFPQIPGSGMTNQGNLQFMNDAPQIQGNTLSIPQFQGNLQQLRNIPQFQNGNLPFAQNNIPSLQQQFAQFQTPQNMQNVLNRFNNGFPGQFQSNNAGSPLFQRNGPFNGNIGTMNRFNGFPPF